VADDEKLLPADLGIVPIDWSVFWADEEPHEEWELEPLAARGRQNVIYSEAKAGKSLVVLDMVAAATTGRPVLGQEARPAIDVVYLDLEMGPDDLRERLTDLGYGPDDDLKRLHYFQLPNLPSLDSDVGGQLLLDIVADHQAQLVVVDTMARAVSGGENESDTYRAFYRHTGGLLKAAGVTVLRLDHAGKRPELGQRGSSGKADDADVVFKLTTDGRRLTFRRTHTRVPWVPHEVVIIRHEEPHLHHLLDAGSWPGGTHDVAQLLDELDVPLDAQTKTAVEALRAAGNGRRKTLVIAALKFRRMKP